MKPSCVASQAADRGCLARVVTGPARADLQSLLRWTEGRFGPRKGADHAAAVQEKLLHLRGGPEPLGSGVAQPGRTDLRKLPLGRRYRHLLIYRALPDRRILILRILHDSMDLARHLPPGTP